MQDAIHVGDGLVLEAHPDGLYILLRREGEVDAVRIYLKEVTWPSSFGEGVSDYA